MISVVVSTKKIDESYREHILKMFSHPKLDVLMYENNGEYSLPEIYNKGLKESVNDIVVFIHDDLILRTRNFAEKIMKLFTKYPEFGIIGVAGTTDLVTGRWWEIPKSSVGWIYHQQNNEIFLSQFSETLYPERPKEVVCIDGVVMMAHKKRIKKEFDTDFKGFHFYDIPFCLSNYVEGVKIGVTTRFDIVHKSVGVTNEQWEENKKQFEEKYKDNLPVRLTNNKTFEEKLKYSRDEIGVGIVTYGNTDRIKYSSLKVPGWIKHFVIINCTELPPEHYPVNTKIILGDEKKSLPQLKNMAMSHLFEEGCNHIFIMEDDIIINNEEVFDKYVKTSLLSGIKHLSFGLHGKLNINEDRSPNMRRIITYPDDIEIAFYKHYVGAFNYYRREVIERIGYYNKEYGIWENAGYEIEASKKTLSSPYWWFADINKSWEYLTSIPNEDESKFNSNKVVMDTLYFRKKHKFLPQEIPDFPFERIQTTIKLMHQTR